MAIDDYSTISKICDTPSMLEVISSKGFRITGDSSTGQWSSTDGLIKLCTEDINPLSPVQPTTSPCSLYSFKGYSHFYKVYPEEFIQTTSGAPDSYSSYYNMSYTPNDSAYTMIEVDCNGGNLYYSFPWFPECYTKLTSWDSYIYVLCDWLTVTVSNNGADIKLYASANTNTASRKGYVSISYSAYNSTSESIRSFGFYVDQEAYVAPVIPTTFQLWDYLGTRYYDFTTDDIYCYSGGSFYVKVTYNSSFSYTDAEGYLGYTVTYEDGSTATGTLSGTYSAMRNQTVIYTGDVPTSYGTTISKVVITLTLNMLV
ncbi:MAG: hypothetical protein R3Y51_06085 [Rikenellaceae bacterium]